jgi:hypothetical protein
MKEFVRQNINPPGINKKNRGAVFSLIGETAGQIRADAMKAFNAHFPYLAGMEKLKEHAKALSVPYVEGDTEETFRSRLTAASFYLMRTGERGYILQQLNERFGEKNYSVIENFLRVKIKVLDLNCGGRSWIKGFFDAVFDPNIFFEIALWIKLHDKINPAEELLQTLKTECADLIVPRDSVSARLSYNFSDIFARSLYLDGSWILDGSELLNGLSCKTAAENVVYTIKTDSTTDSFETTADTFSAAVRKHYHLDGAWYLDGSVDLSGGAIIPLE